MKEKNRTKEKRNQYIILGIGAFLFLVIIPLICYITFFPKFEVKEFQEEINIDYQSSFEPVSGKVCFGTIFSCKDAQVSVENNVDVNTLGEYEVTYTYQYQKETMKLTQKVKVIDKESPNIEIAEADFKYCPNGKVPEYKITATDNLDGDLTNEVETTAKDGHIYFSVKDSSGNETTKEVEAKEEDQELPIITLNGKEEQYLKINETYKEEGVTVNDNCDGDLTSGVTISGEVNTKQVGEYKINYTVKDSSGNEATKTRKVYVYDNNNPNTAQSKTIYLTFDDGPGSSTSRLLDILKKYNVKATFFVTDQGLTKNYDSVILRAYQEGHTIGLHTSSHSYGIYANENTYFNDLYAIQEKVKRITGYTSMIIRFPGGSSNTVSKSYDGGAKIMSYLTKAVEAKGFRYFDWNITSGDAGGTTSSSQVAANVIQGLKSGASVVLQHDIKSFSVDAVETIIQYGLSHGYTFLPLTMASPTVHHHVNN